MKTIFSYFCSKPDRLIVVLLWVYFVYRIIMAGFEPDPFAYNGDFEIVAREYPIGTVKFLIGTMFAHLCLLTVTAAYIKSHWKLLAMFIATMVLLLYFGIFLHAPPEWGEMIAWLFLCCFIISLASIYHIGCFFYRKLVTLKSPQ